MPISWKPWLPSWRPPFPRSRKDPTWSSGIRWSASIPTSWTWRTSPPEGQGDVQVAVNGMDVGTLPAGPRWSKGIFRLPAAALHPGLNRLTLRWPDPPPVEGDPFRPVVERLDLGLEADLHPVFGEVFS